MRIAVLGTGGVGGYFGGRLALGGADVHLIARGEHLEKLRTDGLRVRSLFGDFEARLPATDTPDDVGPCDYVLFCVKSYDTEAAAARLPPLMHDDTAVVSLQNGVDNEEKIASVVGERAVMGGVAYLYSTILEPGMVAHTGGPARILLGELDGSRSERAEALVAQCRRASVDAELAEDIRWTLWDKFAFICAHGGMTAVTRLPIGEVRRTPQSWQMFRRVLQEVAAVAAAEGVDLGEDAVERHASFAESLEPDTSSSLHEALIHGRRMELDALHGTVVAFAERHGIEVPMCRAILALLAPWARRNEERRGSDARSAS